MVDRLGGFQNGRVNPAYDSDDKMKGKTDFLKIFIYCYKLFLFLGDSQSTSSTGDSGDFVVDDFGDVVKVRKSSESNSNNSRKSKLREAAKKLDDDEETSEDGWTTEF